MVRWISMGLGALTFTALTAGLTALTAGCTSISDSVSSPSGWLSDSSGAISDSVTSPSRSASESSSPEEEAAEGAYRDDVRVATRDLERTDARDGGLVRELSRVAGAHGINHWEGHDGTWVAMGEGFRDAGLTERDVDGALARLGGVGARERSLVLEGYAATP